MYLVGVEKDNERLSNENFRLKTEVRQVERNLKRLKHLEKLLAFRNEKAVETIGVKVIGRDASPFVRIVRVKIDRGKGTLRSGLPVITAEGVVGRIGRTYGLYSDVILAVDPKSAIDVVVQRTGSRGVLRGIDGANRCRIDYLLRKEEVKAGDLVITSGVEGIFPTGIPVGRISRVTKRNYKLYQDVEVTPTVDYTALREMLVILAPPPPDASHEVAGIQPARGVLP